MFLPVEGDFAYYGRQVHTISLIPVPRNILLTIMLFTSSSLESEFGTKPYTMHLLLIGRNCNRSLLFHVPGIFYYLHSYPDGT